MTQRVAICFIALGVLLGFSLRSEAAPITWAFEGRVRILDIGEASDLADSLGVTLGASVSGQVSYQFVGGSFGRHDGSLLGFDVAIGSFEIGFESMGCCYFDVDINPPYGDAYRLYGGGGTDALFPQGAPLTLYLFADTPGVIPNLLLPDAPPALSSLRPFSITDWGAFPSAGTGLEIGFGPGSGWTDGRIVVELTSLALVPEPAPVALLALATAFPMISAGRARRPRSGPAGAAIRRGS